MTVDKLARYLAFALAAAALIATAAAAAPTSPAKQKQTVGTIEALAIDGLTVAYDAQGARPGDPDCNRVYAWNSANGRVTRVSGGGTCGADSTSTGAGVTRLAVAGSRIAWIVNTGGNTESNDSLFTATLSKPKERKIAGVRRTGNVDCILVGRQLGGLVGSGSVLAYNMWSVAAADPGDESSCDETRKSGSLLRITPGGHTVLRSGPDTLVASDADGGRIAVHHADGPVELFTAAGKPLVTIGIEPAQAIALSGKRLIVLTRAHTIRVYDTKTGRAGRAFPVPHVVGDLTAAGDIAAYASAKKVHVLRLTSGKDTVVATAPTYLNGVAASSRALAYAYSVFTRPDPTHFRDVGHVVVIPMSQLR